MERTSQHRWLPKQAKSRASPYAEVRDCHCPSPIATNRRLWLKALVGGLLLWALTVAVLWATQVTTLAPVVIFVGSFLSPVVFAVWVFEREEYTGVTPDGKSTALSIPLLVAAFGIGGLVGVTLAALLRR